MGMLKYGSSSSEISFDDRALLHLQIVITLKLRRHESFIFSWTDIAERGSSRSSIWLHPNITLSYRFSGSRIPTVNQEWIETLMESANSGGGLMFTAEPSPHSATLSTEPTRTTP
jgi:hypothetical protein